MLPLVKSKDCGSASNTFSNVDVSNFIFFHTQFIIVRMSGLESTNTINLFRVAPLMFVSLSKTTKLILLDSLLQGVCIKSAWHSLAFEFAQAECLSCQSQTSFIQD